MGRDRQNKIIMIAILCVAVIGLSVGFAAFSSKLTISSSAEVLPDASDFSVKVYGFDQDIPEGSNYEDYWENDIYYTSTTTSRPVLTNAAFGSSMFNTTALNAKITNSSNGMKISDLSVNFSEPSETAIYYFVIRNEGEYDAYLKVDDISKFPDNFTKTCTPVGDTTPALVTAACDGMYINSRIFDYNFKNVMSNIESNGYHIIEPGSFAWFTVIVSYSSTAVRADGDFNVVWEDIPLTFSTTA